jgi:hypothetical protein
MQSSAKGHDMEKRRPCPGVGLPLIAAGRRRSPGAKVFLILGEILLITCLAAALASADSQTTLVQKGNSPMQQTAAAQVKDVPPLDRLLPGRVETFTFGLG